MTWKHPTNLGLKDTLVEIWDRLGSRSKWYDTLEMSLHHIYCYLRENKPLSLGTFLTCRGSGKSQVKAAFAHALRSNRMW
jgi:hypothetical protein